MKLKSDVELNRTWIRSKPHLKSSFDSWPPSWQKFGRPYLRNQGTWEARVFDTYSLQRSLWTSSRFRTVSGLSETAAQKRAREIDLGELITGSPRTGALGLSVPEISWVNHFGCETLDPVISGTIEAGVVEFGLVVEGARRAC
ncbi:hypothetical protein ACJJTC_011508 [Scirpophaga incertulas]